METPRCLRHLAIIPDGNRRWAKNKKLKPWQGHRAGLKPFYEISAALHNSNIPYYTFWAASENNLRKRPKVEVKFLVARLKRALRKEIKAKTLVRDQIRLRIIGRWNEILNDPELREIIQVLESSTQEFFGRNLTLLFGYNGTAEILAGIQTLKQTRQPATAENLQSALWTRDLPPVDLIIRTGGEPHLSAGFMMWLASDSQLYFTNTLWPDFNKKALQTALADYARRERRFGE